VGLDLQGQINLMSNHKNNKLKKEHMTKELISAFERQGRFKKIESKTMFLYEHDQKEYPKRREIREILMEESDKGEDKEKDKEELKEIGDSDFKIKYREKE